MKDYTLTEQQRIGEALARILQLRRSKTHADRWQMTWGDKTNLGLFLTFQAVSNAIQAGNFRSFEGLEDIEKRVNE